MPKFIVIFQSYETGEDLRVTVEADTAQAAIAATDATHPDEYYAYCYVTTPEQERAMNALYAEVDWDWDLWSFPVSSEPDLCPF